MSEVTSPEEKMKHLVARDTSASYLPPSLSAAHSPARCPRCSFPLQGVSPGSRASSSASAWTMAPFLRDSLSTLGAGVAGAVSGVYSFNAVMPPIGRRFPRSLALQYALGVPPVALLSSIGAGLGAGFLPAFVQVCMSSYYTASSTANSLVLSTHTQLTQVKDADAGTGVTPNGSQGGKEEPKHCSPKADHF